MRNGTVIIGLAVGVALILGAWYLTYALESRMRYDPGVVGDDTPSARVIPSPDGVAEAILPPTTAGDARLSSRCGPIVTEPAVTVLPVSTLLEYEESFLPTEAGLYDMTIGVWDNPDFLELTQDEAHELLGLDDTFGFKGPETLLSVAGPLPTEADCRTGFRSHRIRLLLQQVCAYEVLIVEVGEIPCERRSDTFGLTLADLIRTRDSAMRELMKALDEETGFRAWTLWHRLYLEWTR